MSSRAPAALRVALVDDSSTARRLIRATLEHDPGIEVIWEARNGREALTYLSESAGYGRPDAVLLDLEMPELDGLATLEHLRGLSGRPPVIVLSALTRRGARETLEALARGAIDYVCKPQASAPGALDAFRDELLRKVRACARAAAVGAGPATDGAGVRPEPAAAARPEPPSLQKATPGVRPGLVGIAASTGGPEALRTVLSGLHDPFPLPIVITQHMPPGFTAALAEHLTRATGHLCSEARDGEIAEKGRVYLAPGGRHLLVQGSGPWQLRLSDGPPRNYCRPAADPMFESMAEAAGARALAVVLTGLGADGAEGALRIAAAGGKVIAQDEATSVVWGMPGATVRCGAASLILPLDRIAQVMGTMVGVQ